MSSIKEKFIKIIKSLPYELEEEIKKRSTFDILNEITKKYVDAYGTDDLSESDKDCIQSLLCKNNNAQNIFQNKFNKKGLWLKCKLKKKTLKWRKLSIF